MCRVSEGFNKTYSEKRPILLDGGLATLLQRVGLPPHTSPCAWVLAHPDRVAAAHRAFVAAGSERLLTATFRAHPHLEPGWEVVVDGAVELARGAAGAHAAVWASIGPGSTRRFNGASEAEHQRWATGVAAVASRAVGAGVDGVVLETFTDAEEARQAVAAVRAVYAGPLAACLVVGPDGGLLGGGALDAGLRALRRQGADVLGLNCGFGPASVVAALAALPARMVTWVKPNVDAGGSDALVAAVGPWLGQLEAVGGCCGAGPEVIRALRELRAGRPG
jgi:5-methyltetrahydrofolate--homocysteine methyltransferase